MDGRTSENTPGKLAGVAKIQGWLIEKFWFSLKERSQSLIYVGS